MACGGSAAGGGLLARLPGLLTTTRSSFVFVEVLLRRELGEAASADDYVARFPRLAELLRCRVRPLGAGRV